MKGGGRTIKGILKCFRQGRSFIDLALHAGLQALCNRGLAEAGEVRPTRSIATLV